MCDAFSSLDAIRALSTMNGDTQKVPIRVIWTQKGTRLSTEIAPQLKEFSRQEFFASAPKSKGEIRREAASMRRRITGGRE